MCERHGVDICVLLCCTRVYIHILLSWPSPAYLGLHLSRSHTTLLSASCDADDVMCTICNFGGVFTWDGVCICSIKQQLRLHAFYNCPIYIERVGRRGQCNCAGFVDHWGPPARCAVVCRVLLDSRDTTHKRTERTTELATCK